MHNKHLRVLPSEQFISIFVSTRISSSFHPGTVCLGILNGTVTALPTSWFVLGCYSYQIACGLDTALLNLLLDYDWLTLRYVNVTLLTNRL